MIKSIWRQPVKPGTETRPGRFKIPSLTIDPHADLCRGDPRAAIEDRETPQPAVERMQRAEQLLIKSARDEDQLVEQRQGAADRERVHPSDGHGLETEGPKYALQRLQGKG